MPVSTPNCKDLFPRKRKRKVRDLTGKRVNKLTVLERAEDRVSPKGVRHVQWLCQCDCGNTTIRRASAINNGSAKSCGCARSSSNKNKNVKDLTGQKFTRWTVISRHEQDYIQPNGKKSPQWNCICDCGTTAVIVGATLRRGDSKSCGCLKLEKLTHDIDLTGHVFGKLTVIKRAPDEHKYNRRNTMWLCQCECGTTSTHRQNDLIRNLCSSCGCLSQSLNEYYTDEFLTSKNIEFTTQQSFKECMNTKTRHRLYFDFYIPNLNGSQILIECQGVQHYQAVDYFGGEDTFTHQQENDNIKRQFAQDNNFILLEIDCSSRPNQKAMNKLLTNALKPYTS